ncbi:MAG: methionyl aminopeptidase [Chlamydiales bacterium]
MIGRNDPCWCGSRKKWKKCHFPEKNRESISDRDRSNILRQHQVILKTPAQIEGIKRACVLTSEILDATCAKAQAGVTTEELNAYAHQLHLDAGAIPAPLHYGEPPFPKSICTSLNEVICHGIPDDTPLKEGDILNIDVSCILNGYYGDCSRMVVIGQTDPLKQKVTDVSYECLMRAIAVLGPEVPLSAIGDAIEDHATSQGCSVVHQFVGHGVGLEFHEGPQVPHHRNRLSLPLTPGMVFTIEPMINAGVAEGVIDPSNQWTARTLDAKPSAQWEHTVLITDSGYEILTTWKK